MTPRRTQGIQSGPRSATVVSAVSGAVIDQLSAVGYPAMTMESIARIAGVSRTTLYRRWPTKAALLATVVEPRLRSYDDFRPTGHTERDLVLLMQMLRDNAQRPDGRALYAAAGERSPELDVVIGRMLERMSAAFLRILRAPGAPCEDVNTQLDAAVHLLLHGTLTWEPTRGTPPTDQDLSNMVALVLRGWEATSSETPLPKAHSSDPQQAHDKGDS